MVRVAVEFEASGCPLLSSVAELADAAATLGEWSHVYVETAVGYHRVVGNLPDTFVGSESLAEMHDWERAEELCSALSAAHRS